MQRSTSVDAASSTLIERAAGGDRQAFGELYEQHALRVFRHAYFLTGDPFLAEDMTAQTFLKALEAIPRYEDRGVPFIAWLLRITGNLTINYKKAQKNGHHAQLPETLEDEDRFTSPEKSCEVKSNSERVWQLVCRLPHEQRQVVVMRFIDDLPYQEVAQVLNKSVGAVRVIQFRALACLRRMVEEEDMAMAYAGARAS
ncbi:MAG: sigma-70 family RNA polymerase sigma factor [Dehalococcoidia bacterium]